MKEYHAALITFLERDTDTEKKTMCYPLTRIELFMGEIGPQLPAAPRRVFIVIDGKWCEVQ